MIYINCKNIRTKQLTSKLDYIRIRLFLIIKLLREVNYRVRLLDYIRINNTFYISLLKSAKGKQKQAIAL
jgi:hypothetical protein